MLAARAFMQPIHILGNQGKTWAGSLHLNNSPMRGVGLAGGDDLTPPGVPLPDEAWVAGKGVRVRQVFRAVGAPQTGRAAKGRDARLGADTGAGKNN